MSGAVIAYPGNEALAAAIGRALNQRVVALESHLFPDGELYFRVQGEVRGKVLVLACSLDRPTEKALGLLLLAATLRDLGAAKVVLAAPYLAYMRQDKVFRAGEGVSARHFAKLISSAFDALVTVDPHLHRIHALSEVYSIPTRVAHAAPAIAAWIAHNVTAPIVIGPDAESEQWASEIATLASCPFAVLEKKRHGDRSVEVTVPDPQRLRGHTPVLVDDIISTGRTMIAAAQHLRQLGSPAPYCVGVHAIFAESAYEELIADGLARIVTCNTISHPSNGIDVHALLSEEIRHLWAPVIG